MATLVLGAFGTLVGGPVGGAIGALAGRQIDGAIIGNGSRDGPRLKELAVSTSSYGTPIPRHFGRMRVPGTIIWATELNESRETGGGGKGQPRTTTYSYSTSFAVALCSRPIHHVGRIWADGNLLRGAAGDLKVGGGFRLHRGYDDQSPDPLIASDRGSGTPAFRGLAYIVFEDLQLGDFGNRIPALTFEVFADTGPLRLDTMVAGLPEPVEADRRLDGLIGYSYESGPLADTIGMLDVLYPIAINAGGKALSLSDNAVRDDAATVLPAPVVAEGEDEFGSRGGQRRERRAIIGHAPGGLRDYDVSRDYQPGVQHAIGRASNTDGPPIDFPGALTAANASERLASARSRLRWASDRLHWRVSTVDPRLMPGRQIILPAANGDDDSRWIVEEWEWRDIGVELILRRLPAAPEPATAGDSGAALAALDALVGPTILTAFELPWDGEGSSGERRIFVAAGSPGAAWRGATLYRDGPDGLDPIAALTRAQAAIGRLDAPLAGAASVLFNGDAQLVLTLDTAHPGLPDADIRAIAMGANRLLVGDETLQYARAERLSETRWRLTGLLRGRGGSEHTAAAGHHAGAPIVLLDDALRAIDPANVPLDSAGNLAAIGLGDSEPVITTIRNPGRSREPLPPVHGGAEPLAGDRVRFSWIRRARGAWGWHDGVEVPLNEERELYAVGIGDPATTDAIRETTAPAITLTRAEIGGEAIWVRQIGRFARSRPLLIATSHNP